MTFACPKCQIEYKAKKCGATVELMSAAGPYQLYAADLWACPGCGAEVLGNFASKPIAEHFEVGYAEAVRIARERSKPYFFRIWSTVAEKAKCLSAPIVAAHRKAIA